MKCSVPKKPVKKIMISKKTGMPIVEEEKPEVEEDVELTPVCNSGEKRNKKEAAEEALKAMLNRFKEEINGLKAKKKEIEVGMACRCVV